MNYPDHLPGGINDKPGRENIETYINHITPEIRNLQLWIHDLIRELSNLHKELHALRQVNDPKIDQYFPIIPNISPPSPPPPSSPHSLHLSHDHIPGDAQDHEG